MLKLYIVKKNQDVKVVYSKKKLELSKPKEK